MRDDQAHGLRRLFTQRRACLLAVLGEEGSAIALELALALGELGQRVLVLDRSCGECAQLAGTGARYELRHVLAGERTLRQVTLELDGNVTLLPASRALAAIDEAGASHWLPLCRQLDAELGPFDVLLVNGAPPALAEANVLLALAPTSSAITHAYTELKKLARRGLPRRCEIVIQRARSEAAALDAFDSVAITAGRFLGMSLALAGTLPGARRRPLEPRPPRDAAARRIAERLLAEPVSARKAVNH